MKPPRKSVSGSGTVPDSLLYLRSDFGAAGRRKMAAVRHYAAVRGWKVTVGDFPDSTKALKIPAGDWLGVIVDCGLRPQGADLGHLASTPVVYIDLDHEHCGFDAYTVRHDSFHAGVMAGRNLLDAGLRNFAYLPHEKPIFWCRERERGFRQTVTAGGGTFSRGPVPGNGDSASSALRSWLRELPRPCGIFLARDSLARKVYAAIAELSLSVPQDFALIGVDDDPQICPRLTPPLSSIGLDAGRAGHLAAALLDRLLACPERAPRLVLAGNCYVSLRGSILRNREARRLDKVLEAIRSHACDGLTALDVVQMIGGGRRTAENRFRAATGRSIYQLIVDIRMERVFACLLNPRIQLKNIADMTGWKSRQALRKTFLLRTGRTLSRWREENMVRSAGVLQVKAGDEFCYNAAY